MGMSCRCWAPRTSSEGQAHSRFSEEARESVEALRDEKKSLSRKVSTCEAVLTTRQCRLDDAKRFASLADSRMKRVEADIIVTYQDWVQLTAAKSYELAVQVDVATQKRRSITEVPVWSDGHEWLLGELKLQHEQLEARLVDRRRLNWWTSEELAGFRRTSETLFRLGDQETCGLAAMREQNDKISSELERTLHEIEQMRELDDNRAENTPTVAQPVDLERLLRGVTLTDLDVVQMEKDLGTARKLNEAAQKELDEAIAFRRRVLDASVADAIAGDGSSGSEPEEISVLLARIERRITTNPTARLAAQTLTESTISVTPRSANWHFASPDRRTTAEYDPPLGHDSLRFAAADETAAPTIGTPNCSGFQIQSLTSIGSPSPQKRWGHRDAGKSFDGEIRGPHELAKAEACNRALQKQVEEMRSQLAEQRLQHEIGRLQHEHEFVHGDAFALSRLQREISAPPSPELDEDEYMLRREQLEQERLRQEILAKTSGVRTMTAANGLLYASSPSDSMCTK